MIAHKREACPGADDPKRDGHQRDEEKRILHRTTRKEIGGCKKQTTRHTGKLFFQGCVLVNDERPFQGQENQHIEEGQQPYRAAREGAVSERRTYHKPQVCEGLDEVQKRGPGRGDETRSNGLQENKVQTDSGPVPPA